MLVHFRPFNLPGDGRGAVLAGVIDHNDQIDVVLIHYLPIGADKGLFRIVGGHDHDDFSIAIHRVFSGGDAQSVF